MSVISSMFLSLFLSCFFVTKAFASTGAVSAGLADTGRASVEVIGGPTMNPALIGFLKGYLLSSSYSFSGDQDGRKSNDFLVNITDNQRDTVVPTSLIYNQSKWMGNNEPQLTEKEIRLAFGNRVSRNWAFGLGFKYKENAATAAVPEAIGELPERQTQTNIDVGNVFPLQPNLGFALVFENVLPPQSSAHEEWRYTPKTAVGFNYDYSKTFQFRLDVTSASNNSFTNPVVGMGIQSYPNRWTAIRLGTQKDLENKADIYSTGLGFSGPKFAVNYAYNQSPQLARLTRHSFDLELPLW